MKEIQGGTKMVSVSKEWTIGRMLKDQGKWTKGHQVITGTKENKNDEGIF